MFNFTLPPADFVLPYLAIVGAAVYVSFLAWRWKDGVDRKEREERFEEARKRVMEGVYRRGI